MNYDVKKVDAVVIYMVEFTSELPKSGKLILRLNGLMGESDAFNFNSKTASTEANKLIYKVSNRDIGEVRQDSQLLFRNQFTQRNLFLKLKLATILYDDEERPELTMKSFKVTDSEGNNYL